MADEKLDTQIRREQIAEAALNLVASQGLRRLSVAAVARQVGLVPSGIYRHFPSKNAILDAVVDLMDKKLQANVAAACQEHEAPLDRLRSILMRHIRIIREGRAIPRMIFSDDMHAGRTEAKQRVQRVAMRYIGQIAEIIRQGQTQGVILAELDADALATMFFGMIVPAGILWHLSDGGFDVTRHAERSWRTFARVVQPANGAAKA